MIVTWIENLSEFHYNNRAMKKVYIETYGCQMNLADTEIVLSILSQAGYTQTTNIAESDVVLVNTCAVRDNAESVYSEELECSGNTRRKIRALLLERLDVWRSICGKNCLMMMRWIL